jgi:predicted nucleic acid-binding protein
MLINHRDLTVQDADVVALALTAFEGEPGVSFSDCLVLEVARRAGHLSLGTFDRDLAGLDGTQRLRPYGKARGRRPPSQGVDVGAPVE